MDIAKYLESKLAGNVQLRNYGQSFQIVKRQFDADTGAEIVPQISTFTEQELIAQKANLEKLLASVNAMLADMQALNPTAPKPLP